MLNFYLIKRFFYFLLFSNFIGFLLIWFYPDFKKIFKIFHLALCTYLYPKSCLQIKHHQDGQLHDRCI